MTPHQAEIDALSDPDPHTRAAAAKRLGEARCTDALAALVGTMNWRQEDVEDEIEGRSAAVTALGRLNDPRAIPPLMALLESMTEPGAPLDDYSDCLTLNIMESLAELQAEEALPFFVGALRSHELEVVKMAIWCLRQYQSYDAVPALLELLADRSSVGRGRAAETLGLIGDSRALPVLIAIMENEHENEWLRNNAAEALGRIGGKDTFERLLAAFLDVGLNENVRYGVSMGLGHLRDPRAFEPLCEALRSSKWPIFLVEALGNLGDRRAVPVLIDCLQHRRHEVVEKSAMALSQLEDQRAIEPLRRARSSWGDNTLGAWVKTAIDKALAHLSSHPPVRPRCPE